MIITPDLTKLQITLEGETDIILRRDFNHPPARVWRALTEPALIRQWMAIEEFPMTRCEMDVRDGGSFHYQWAGADGQSPFFSGPILTINPPHQMTYVEYFNGNTTSGAAVTTDLVANGTGTRMIVVMRYETSEARAAAIATGMTDGMEDVYGKLDALQIAE